MMRNDGKSKVDQLETAGVSLARGCALLLFVVVMLSGCSLEAEGGDRRAVQGCGSGSHGLGLAVVAELDTVGGFDANAVAGAMFESQPKFRFVHTELSGICESAIIVWNEAMRASNPNPEPNGVDYLILVRFPDPTDADAQFDHLVVSENASGESLLEQLDEATWVFVRGLTGRNATLRSRCVVAIVGSTTNSDPYIEVTRELLEVVAARTC